MPRSIGRVSSSSWRRKEPWTIPRKSQRTGRLAHWQRNAPLFFHRLSRNGRDDDAIYTAPAEQPSNRVEPRNTCRPMTDAPDSRPVQMASRDWLARTHVSYPVLEDSLAAGYATQVRATYVELLQSEIELSVIM